MSEPELFSESLDSFSLFNGLEIFSVECESKKVSTSSSSEVEQKVDHLAAVEEKQRERKVFILTVCSPGVALWHSDCMKLTSN